MPDKYKIRAQMQYSHDTYKSLAKAMGVAPNTMCQKINGVTKFTADEIKWLMDYWKLTAKETVEMFINN